MNNTLVLNKFRTPEEVKADFVRRGISIASWARQYGISPKRVYDVLSRRNKGTFGEAHRVAVLLGIKEGIVNQTINPISNIIFEERMKLDEKS